MDIHHSKVSKGVSDTSFNVNALAPLLGYRQHLALACPELCDEIEIGFIKGTNGTEICFSHNLGWENENWSIFISTIVFLPIAIANCKKYGVKKFVFFYNNEFKEFSLDNIYVE